jgi:hypothetical protein
VSQADWLSMDPVAVEASLLRVLLTPDLKLDIGRLLMVRVATVEPGGRGLLSLAGVLLEAELPEGVSAGQELKLEVRELTPQKVVLAIQNDAPQIVPPLIADLIIAMPLGGSVRLHERPPSGSTQLPDGSHTVKLRYDAPSFGPVDMHFTLGAEGSLRLAVVVPAGEALADAQATAEELLDSLTRATGSRASLSITPRHEPLEIFA